MPRMSKRKGFAMPMAIFVIAVLTAALAAGFSGTTTEITTNNAVRGQNRAFQLAEAGLEAFMVRRGESGWCTNCAGPRRRGLRMDARVVDGGLCRRRRGESSSDHRHVERPLFHSFHGHRHSTEAQCGSRLAIRDTRRWYLRHMEHDDDERPGGVAEPFGIELRMERASSAVSISAAEAACRGRPRRQRRSSRRETASIPTAIHRSTRRTPSCSSRRTPSIGPTFIQNSRAGHHDSRRLVSAGAFQSDSDYWPVIRIHSNNFSLPNRGRGIIIADSDFTISGSNMWDGIIMVGGQLTSNGNNTTAGATLSGLNFMLGGNANYDRAVLTTLTRTVKKPTSTIRATSQGPRSVCVATRRCQTPGWTTWHPGSPGGWRHRSISGGSHAERIARWRREPRMAPGVHRGRLEGGTQSIPYPRDLHVHATGYRGPRGLLSNAS